MARRDLTNEEIERMGREEPGSAAEYLRLRREELEAEKLLAREEDEERRFVELFVENGGTEKAGRESYRRLLDASAEQAAGEEADAAMARSRRRITQAL